MVVSRRCADLLLGDLQFGLTIMTPVEPSIFVSGAEESSKFGGPSLELRGGNRVSFGVWKRWARAWCLAKSLALVCSLMCARVLAFPLSPGLPMAPDTMLAAAATAAAAAASRWARACWARALMSARVLAPVFLPPLTDVLLVDARDSGLETGWLLMIKGGPILESWI